MSTPRKTSKISGVKTAIRSGNFPKALAKVDALLEDSPGNPLLLVRRAELIQLQEEAGPPLTEAKQALREALAWDGDNADALIELGHYQFAIDDDAKGAAKTFAKAAGVCKRFLVQALVGRAQVLLELDRRQEAFDCLAQARLLQAPGGNGAVKPRSHTAQRLMETWEELTGIS